MRRFGMVCVMLLGSMGGALAQGMPDGGTGMPNGGPGGGMEHGGRGAMHACMEEHLGGVREQIHAQMMQWRAANPNATREAVHMERRQLMEPFRPQMAAARDACGMHRHGEGRGHRGMMPNQQPAETE